MKTNGKKQKRIVAVQGMIFREDGKILLTQRNQPQSPRAHDKWQLPGGGMEFGEHPKETLIREIKEETGLEIEPLSEEPIITSSLVELGEEHLHVLILAYPARYKSGTVNIEMDEETKDAKWCEISEIDFSLCLPEAQEIIMKGKDYLIY